MNKELLTLKQSYPLEIKIELTKNAIRDFVHEYGIDGVYISFSGGKDSTVLLNICYELYGESIPAVFSNTKNEFKSIVEHVNYVKHFYNNVHTVIPDNNIEDVIKKFGYPVVSKKVSRMLRDLQNPSDKNSNTRKLYLTGEKKDGSHSKYFKLPNKYKYLIDAPFKIS